MLNSIRGLLIITLFLCPLSAFAQGATGKIEIKNYPQTGLVARWLLVDVHIEINQNPGFEGYWTNAWPAPISCHSSRWGTTLTQHSSSMPLTAESKLLPLPLQKDEQFGISLPAGRWVCGVRLNFFLQSRNGRKEEIALSSAEFTMEVQEPTEEDIKFLQSLGFWKDYGAGRNDAGGLPLDQPELLKFPNSSYYCQFWVGQFRGESGFTRVPAIEAGLELIFTPHPGARMITVKDDEPMDSQRQLHVDVIDNLLHSPCRRASREELLYWKTMSYLYGGKFKQAKVTALEGRRCAKDERYLKFFKKMASFHDEQDFLAAVAPVEKGQ